MLDKELMKSAVCLMSLIYLIRLIDLIDKHLFKNSKSDNALVSIAYE
jgi:hypothetical protein